MAEYQVLVGWDTDDFSGIYDDITSDVKLIRFSRGKNEELGKAEVGQLSLTLNNDTAKYTPSNTGSVLYDDLLPRRPVKVIAKEQLVQSSVTKALAATGDYAAEDVMSESEGAGTAWTFTDIVPHLGGSGYITKAQIICQTTNLTPRLALYLYTALPTSNLNDNAAHSLLHADTANYIGMISFSPLSDLGGNSESVATISLYNYIPLSFNCAINSRSLYGIVVTRDAITGEAAGMNLTIKLTIEITDTPLFYGYIEEIIPHPHLTEQDCIITAIDGLDFLSRHDMATALYKNVLTGAIHGYILDDAGWTAGRSIDTGQDTVPYWYGHEVKARFAQGEIDDSEQGFSYVNGAGDFVFEDRHHRSTATHQTSQATFDNTMAQITYSLNPKNVYNITKATITPWSLQSEAELWRLRETPVIPAGATNTYWGEAAVDGKPVFVDAWTTPVITTDYTATGSVTIVTTKFAKTIKLEVTNNEAIPITLTLLKARGTWYDDFTKVTRKAEDTTSQTNYQKRTLEIAGKYLTDADKAQDWANYAIGKYKNPRAELSMSVVNQDAATLAKILNIKISDRITVVNTKLGISGDYFVDYLEHTISKGGLLHTAKYRLSDTTNEDFWCLDFSALGTTTKLGY